MTIAHVIILLATGMVAGFAGGLLGLGGGFIMTPVQFYVFTSMGLPTDLAIKLAFGTNLLAILPTAISGAWRHHQNRAVWWRAALTMGGFSLTGGLIGSTIAAHLPGAALKIVFGALVLLSATRMLTARPPAIDEKPKSNIWLWAAWALPVGIVTGLTGIGGGVLVVPIMTLALKFKIHNAVATSMAMMILTSTGSVIGYMLNGLGVPDLPPYSVGYVNLQSALVLAATSVGMAQVGAMTAYRLPAKQLRYVFIALMFYIGLKMVGLFDWLGWPL